MTISAEHSATRRTARRGVGLMALALLLVAAVAFALLQGSVDNALAQETEIPQVPHSVRGHEPCLVCHGVDGLHPAPENHRTFVNEMCFSCHLAAPVPEEVLAIEDPEPNSYCLSCHEDPNLAIQIGNTTLSLHVEEEDRRSSAHADLSCQSCHRGKATFPHAPVDYSDFKAYRANATRTCSSCHMTIASEYSVSVHGQELLAGEGDGAACFECHSPSWSAHDIRPLEGSEAVVYPRNIGETCGRCHEHELETYLDTSHRKVVQYGDPSRPATCVTCHSDHNVQPSGDPDNPLNTERLARICGRCHRGADESFVANWPGHREASPNWFPIVYFTERFFLLLTAMVVGVGIIHVELELFRWAANLIRRRRRRR